MKRRTRNRIQMIVLAPLYPILLLMMAFRITINAVKEALSDYINEVTSLFNDMIKAWNYSPKDKYRGMPDWVASQYKKKLEQEGKLDD